MAQTEFERGYLAGKNETIRLIALRVLDTCVPIPREEVKQT